MKNSVKIFGGNFFGLREDGLGKIENKWIPISNRKYRNGKRGRHTATCPHCGEKKKNIHLHYRKYHAAWFKKFFIDPLEKGEVGMISQVRFFQSIRLVNSFDIDNSKLVEISGK